MRQQRPQLVPALLAGMAEWVQKCHLVPVPWLLVASGGAGERTGVGLTEEESWDPSATSHVGAGSGALRQLPGPCHPWAFVPLRGCHSSWCRDLPAEIRQRLASIPRPVCTAEAACGSLTKGHPVSAESWCKALSLMAPPNLAPSPLCGCTRQHISEAIF